MELLARLDRLVDETPREEGEMRFGNKAFRAWHDKVARDARELHQQLVLPPDVSGAQEAWPELAAYLLDSFGNPVRIDYGTGHELHFVIWMYCLHALGLAKQEDFTALVTQVFARYLKLGAPSSLAASRCRPAPDHRKAGLQCADPTDLRPGARWVTGRVVP